MTAGFRTRMQIEDADDRDDGEFLTLAPLVYQSAVANLLITVPAGFRTDLTSVPRWPVVFLLCGGTCNKIAIVHDWLYTTQPVPRRMADAVLREGSRVLGDPAWRCWGMWVALRLAGWTHWSQPAWWKWLFGRL